MSRKTKPAAVILGPDGKPLDVAAVRKAEPKTVITTGEGVPISSDVVSYSFTLNTSSILDSLMGRSSAPSPYSIGFSHPKAAPKPKSLADAMGEQVAALTADFDGIGGVSEAPKPVADLTAYEAAYASAAANCLHDDAIEILYGREWTCDACGRHLNREDMRRAAAKRNSGSIYRYFGL